MSRYRTWSLAMLASLAVTTACADLSIANPNEPDRARALTSGVDIESLISSTFRTWWGLQQGSQALTTPAAETNLANALSAASDETADSGLGGTGEVTDEPRIA